MAGNLAGEFDPQTAAQVERMKAGGLPLAVGVAPIVDIIDGPPAEPLTAFSEGRRLSLTGPSFDRGNAARLESITKGSWVESRVRTEDEPARAVSRPVVGGVKTPEPELGRWLRLVVPAC